MVNIIVGTDASDDLDGTVLDDSIFGYSGNDQLWGWGGWDTLDGGDGDDDLVGGAGADKLNGGNGSDFLIGGSGADRLSGGAGNQDAAVYSDSPAAVTVTIGGTGHGGDAEGDVIGSDVEAVFGSVFGDTLDGSAGANSLFGLEGNDVLRGGAGADTLNGGAGTDTASYYTGTAGVSVDLATGRGTGGEAQGDTLTAIENLSGSQGNDTLAGNAGANVLQGLGGNDTLRGAAGADHLDGGAGTDLASYWGAAVAVTVNLASGTGSGGEAQGDTLVSIENLNGGKGGDNLTGNAGANALTGYEGNDLLRGGAGADHLDGGAGTDLASYWGAAAAVTVNLTSGTGRGGEAQGDTLAGIENVNGGRAGDAIAGNAAANVLNGYEGNDALRGAGGKDTLTGGAGTDRFVYAAIGESAVGANADRITDFSHAQADHVDLSAIDANTGAAGNQAFTFIGTGLYTRHAGELRYAVSGGTTTIGGDVNGDGVTDFHIVLTGHIALAAGDFML